MPHFSSIVSARTDAANRLLATPCHLIRESSRARETSCQSYRRCHFRESNDVNVEYIDEIVPSFSESNSTSTAPTRLNGLSFAFFRESPICR